MHNAYNNVQLSMWSGDISQINDKNKNTIIPSTHIYVALDVENNGAADNCYVLNQVKKWYMIWHPRCRYGHG